MLTYRFGLENSDVENIRHFINYIDDEVPLANSHEACQYAVEEILVNFESIDNENV